MEEETNDSNERLTKWNIVNAGVIITHPFLSRLFKNLDYLDNKNQFKNEDLQFRAVYLLHYIATGKNSNIMETDLAMPKLLAGLRIEDHISSNLVLLQKEKNESNELLTALISHWETLGNTSIEGLQEAFFIREGLIEKNDEAFQLTIENLNVDILLNNLPWSINSIKLPWLEHIIYVSWR